MSDLLSATSLLIAIVSAFVTLWAPGTEALLSKVNRGVNESDKPLIRRDLKEDYSKWFVIMIFLGIAQLALLSSFIFTLIIEPYIVFDKYGACFSLKQYDPVKALFIVIYLFGMFMLYVIHNKWSSLRIKIEKLQ
jgi:hypothetical protein